MISYILWWVYKINVNEAISLVLNEILHNFRLVLTYAYAVLIYFFALSTP